MTKKSDGKTVINPKKPHKTAEQFRDLHFPNLISFQDEWLSWNGSAYLPIEDATMEARISQFLIESFIVVMAQTTGADGTPGPIKKEFMPFSPARKDIAEVYAALAHLCHKPADTMSPPSWLKGRKGRPDPRNIISCSNGLLDITTGELHDQTPEFFTRTALPIEYDQFAPNPERWLQYLREVTADRQPLIDLLQEMVGYLIACDTSQQKVFFLLGPPRSGKGTFLRTTTALVGSANIGNPTIEGLAAHFGYQSLIGKSVAFISDMTCHVRDKLSTAANRINAVSGEDSVSAPRKFKEDWNGRLLIRFLLAGNHLPDFGDHAAAIATRLLFAPFDVSFEGREDFNLESKLLLELPSILNWALAGLARLRDVGRFIEPADSRHVKTRMLYLANPLLGFRDECCAVEIGAEIEKKIMHDQYVVYCTAMGVRPLSRDAFAEKLYEIVPSADAGKAAPSQGRVPIFRGIRLNDELLAEHYEVDQLNVTLGNKGMNALKLDADGRPIPRALH
jgi:putative DNA primase/helicase